MGVLGEKGDGWQGELGLREGAVVMGRPGIAAKGDAAQDSAVFFNT